MYRMIYFNPSFGYKTIDYQNSTGIVDAEEVVKNNNASIICVVDYGRKAIINKCVDFANHQEQIDQIIFDPKMLGLYY